MMANRLLRWSRKYHQWVGLYVAILAMIWMVEMIALPFIFNPGLPTLDDTPPALEQDATAPISLQQALKIFMAQQPKGITSTAALDEMTYLPKKGVYRFANRTQFLVWYLDAKTGRILQYGFDSNRFVTEKGMLGWAHPVVAKAVRLVPFDFLFIFLTVTGCWIVFAPRRKKKRKPFFHDWRLLKKKTAGKQKDA
ncbi:MAG: hypothetical protein CSA22_01500 [Deltaproteobacteria bacterium]|nr:MAG: hypothetical protein CSA22_01500 [Deltaproteobacteria bacterium]